MRPILTIPRPPRHNNATNQPTSKQLPSQRRRKYFTKDGLRKRLHYKQLSPIQLPIQLRRHYNMYRYNKQQQYRKGQSNSIPSRQCHSSRRRCRTSTSINQPNSLLKRANF